MLAGAAIWTTERVAPVVRDLVRGEISRLRPGGAWRSPPVGGAGRGSSAEAGDLPEPDGVDSLELLTLATAVSRQFHLHETGLDDLLLARRTAADWAEIVVRSRSAWDEAITFSTSGSTGEPKPCTHRMEDLLAEVRALSALFAGRRRVLTVQPAHHIYGFIFTFLLPAALGVPVLDVRAHGPAALFRRARPGDLVVAHPHYLDLATSLPVQAAEDVIVATSTAPCDAAVWRRLAGQGVSAVAEVYGSSETAGIGLRMAADDAFELLPVWDRAEGEAGALVRRGGGPQLRALPDRVEWTGDRRFVVGGRLDGAVQVGGVNVFPSRIRDLLREHPAVADAAVRLMRPGEGRRLKAFVVPRAAAAGTASLADELTRWLEGRTSPLAVPRSFRFGATLPVSEAGKAADWSSRA